MINTGTETTEKNKRPKTRYKIEQDADGFRIVIPAKKYPLLFIFTISVLLILLYCPVTLVRGTESLTENQYQNFLIILLWSSAILYTAIRVLWYLFGREIIKIHFDYLTVMNKLFICYSSNKYLLQNIKNMKISQKIIKIDYAHDFWKYAFEEEIQHYIEFEYKDKSILLGLELTDNEIDPFLKEISARYPNLVDIKWHRH